jgi:hypothetical protein
MGHFTVVGNDANGLLKTAMNTRLELGIEKTKSSEIKNSGFLLEQTNAN